MSSTAPGATQLWRDLLACLHDMYGTRSLRTYEIANIAHEVGFPISKQSSEGYGTHLTDEYGNHLPNIKQEQLTDLSAFGMLLRRKHGQVFGDFRFVCDRIDRGWSSGTTRTTYHVEPKDEPRTKSTSNRFSQFDVEPDE